MKELYQLLRIKPKKVTDCTLFCEYYDTSFEAGYCSHYLAGECTQEKEVYPDLTNAENFVKVLECYTETAGSVVFESIEDTLYQVMTDVKSSYFYSEALKQALQQVDWEY